MHTLSWVNYCRIITHRESYNKPLDTRVALQRVEVHFDFNVLFLPMDVHFQKRFRCTTAIHRFTIQDNKFLKTITDYRHEDKYDTSKYNIRTNT